MFVLMRGTGTAEHGYTVECGSRDTTLNTAFRLSGTGTQARLEPVAQARTRTTLIRTEQAAHPPI